MRVIIDSLVALMLAGMLIGVFMHTSAERRLEDKIELARAEVERFQSQIMLQAALETVEKTQRGYPITVDAAWFGGALPMNPLLGPGFPWLEIAAESQRNLRHPSDLLVFNRDLAQFWYNPYTGVVRARVQDTVSDAKALRLYNRINGTDLQNLYAGAG